MQLGHSRACLCDHPAEARCEVLHFSAPLPNYRRLAKSKSAKYITSPQPNSTHESEMLIDFTWPEAKVNAKSSGNTPSRRPPKTR